MAEVSSLHNADIRTPEVNQITLIQSAIFCTAHRSGPIYWGLCLWANICNLPSAIPVNPWNNVSTITRTSEPSYGTYHQTILTSQLC